VNTWLEEDIDKAMRAAKANADDMREHQGVTVPIGFEDALVDVNFNMGADWKTRVPFSIRRPA
jgi:GH24 family phage-related lysozyme (muramidase)